jgi:hypothetical protein
MSSAELTQLLRIGLTIFGAICVILFFYASRDTWRYRRADNRFRKGRPPGKKTARILGASKGTYRKGRPPGTIERGHTSKQRGMYFRMP